MDSFTGENPEIRLDDWLPALDRASLWNQWKYLIQFAGHLRGRALQEWNLMDARDTLDTTDVIEALQWRLEPKTRTLAAQDFRHTSQNDGESVSNFIRRMERTFAITYRVDDMSMETRETLLHGQLQEGLSYQIMKAPAVSGAQSYRELVMAAKHEERRRDKLS